MIRGKQYNKRRLLLLVLTLALSGALGARPRAHDLERTQVAITFGPEGSFVADVLNDPNWLLLRLEPFAGNGAPRLIPPAQRDARLAQLGEVFIDRVVLFVDGHEVRPEAAEYIPPAPLRPTDDRPPLATYRLRGHIAPGARVLRWFYGLVIDPYPLILRRADGRSHTEWVGGTDWSGTLDLSGQVRVPTRRQVALQYLALGYTHILPKGVDHVLFVLGIFLLSVKLRPILIQVTTFTIAHSITLALTMYGIVSLPSGVVEPMIALSIAYVAIENLVTTELKPWRLALVFSFGLLHGMGFAGVLRDLGLPRAEFLTALLGFNLGVEGGQLTVIALAVLCVSWFQRRHWYHERIVVPVSLVIATIGIYWTIVRVAR